MFFLANPMAVPSRRRRAYSSCSRGVRSPPDFAAFPLVVVSTLFYLTAVAYMTFFFSTGRCIIFNRSDYVLCEYCFTVVQVFFRQKSHFLFARTFTVETQIRNRFCGQIPYFVQRPFRDMHRSTKVLKRHSNTVKV